MVGGNGRAATIGAACSGATLLTEMNSKEFLRCTRRVFRSAKTATLFISARDFCFALWKILRS